MNTNNLLYIIYNLKYNLIEFNLIEYNLLNKLNIIYLHVFLINSSNINPLLHFDLSHTFLQYIEFDIPKL